MKKEIYPIDSNFHPGIEDKWLAFVPTAAILVTCISKEGKPNIIPLTGWGVLCRFPFIIGIAICQGNYTKNYFPRYSRLLLDQVPEFVVNIPHNGLRDAITICGQGSGDKMDKFKEANLTPESSIVVRPPAIKECPVAFECKVIRVVRGIGSHDIYLGETVAVHNAIEQMDIDEDIMKLSLFGDEDNRLEIIWHSLPFWKAANTKA